MRSPRRIVTRALLILVGIVLLGVVASALVLWQASGDLQAGRDALLDGKRALLAGEAPDAVTAFDDADRRFDSAADDLGGPVALFAAALPGLGNHVDVARAVAEAGGSAADAGTAFSGSLAGLPEGLGALAPVDGRLPIERYAEVADAARTAAADADDALAAIEDAPTTFLLAPVLDARWDAEADLREAVRALDAAAALLEGVPGFAGADGPRRYLVVSENPAELRGTGGLWGAYAILTFRDGRASVGEAAATPSLPDVSVDDIEPPNPDYRRNYDQFGGAASWANLNMTPDFPSASRAALGNWEAGGGTPLDGVIAADPFALETMLRVTGPTTVPGTDITVGADDVVAFMANEAYAVFTVAEERKRILGAVAADVLGRFLELKGQALPRIRALGEAAGGGHLKIYVRDPDLQAGVALSGAGGSFAADPGDVVAVHVNNGSGNKVDFWASRRVSYRVELGGEGEALSTLETTIGNAAPTEGYLRHVLGPWVDDLGPGDQYPLITASCHEPCELIEARRDGEPVAVAIGSELGIPWYRDYRPILAGDRGRLALEWRTEGVWEGTSSDGAYRLTFLGQTTIEPTDLRVEITAPAGADIIWTSAPMEVDGGTATWRGTPRPRTVLEVRFRAPLPVRWWRGLTG